MGSGYSKIKKKAQLAQQQLSDMQEQLSQMEEVGISGNGLVTITLSGEKSIKKVKIQKECVDSEDIEGLEDLIIAAHRDAEQKIDMKNGSKNLNPFSLSF